MPPWVVCIKFASDHFNSFEIVVYRGIIGVLFQLILTRSNGVSLKTKVPMMHVWRSSQHAADEEKASGGRHPLPSRERFAETLRRMGLDHGMQVVVYDRQGAQNCGRLWWMLKWCGHEAVAVLDGGLPCARG